MSDTYGVLAGVPEPMVASGRDEALGRLALLASRAHMLTVVQRMAVHDFNDSLNSLTLNVELLARVLDGDVPADKKTEVEQRAVNAIRQELKRLARGTGGVLEAGAQRAQLSDRVALTPTIEHVLSGLRNVAQRRRVSITFQPPASLIEVRGRTDELGLAIFNLALNGIEAMADGGELTVMLATEGRTAVVAISDTGAGVPPPLRASLWAPFVSTKPEGLGIGLFVVKNIAAGHGGTVEIEHRETGVTCLMRLPLFQ